MPRNRATEPTQAEWKVLKILWEIKGGALGDVFSVAQEEHGWAHSTVKTILKRLVDKGYVKTKRVGNSFWYQPVRSPMKSMASAIEGILDQALEGTSGPILAHVIKNTDLSIEEIQQLKDILAEHSAIKENNS